MKGFALGLSLSIAFILGCVSSPLVTRGASAQDEAEEEVPAHVQRWQHYCYLDHPPDYDLDRLNELGNASRTGPTHLSAEPTLLQVDSSCGARSRAS